MENIIQQFINASNNIVKYYNNSRVPKYFKDQKLNRKRSDLLKELDKLFKYQSSPVKIITDYALVLTDNYKPFGSHLNCRRSIKVTSSSAVCIFEFKLDNDNNLVVSFDPANDDGSLCNINYAYISNGKPKLSFTDTGIYMIRYFDITLSDDNIADYLRSETAKYIIKDITDYLKPIICKEV